MPPQETNIIGKKQPTETSALIESSYPFAHLLWDLIRYSFATVFGLFLIILAYPSPIVMGIIALFTSLFIFALMRLLIRTQQRFFFFEDSLSMTGPFPKTLSPITAMSLRYYGPRKKKRKGVVLLKLSQNGKNLKLESQLDHFEDIVLWAYKLAQKNGLSIDPLTFHNVKALGISP